MTFRMFPPEVFVEPSDALWLLGLPNGIGLHLLIGATSSTARPPDAASEPKQEVHILRRRRCTLLSPLAGLAKLPDDLPPVPRGRNRVEHVPALVETERFADIAIVQLSHEPDIP